MPTTIRLAPDTEQRLDFLAAQTGRSKAYYLREIIEGGILAWMIEYTETAREQLRKLDRQVARRILDYMDERIQTPANPLLSPPPRPIVLPSRSLSERPPALPAP